MRTGAKKKRRLAAGQVRLTVLKKMPAAKRGVCCGCGCSSEDACRVHGIPCTWIEYEGRVICSACAPVEVLTGTPAGRNWLHTVLKSVTFNTDPQFEPSEGQLKKMGAVS